MVYLGALERKYGLYNIKIERRPVLGKHHSSNAPLLNSLIGHVVLRGVLDVKQICERILELANTQKIEINNNTFNNNNSEVVLQL